MDSEQHAFHQEIGPHLDQLGDAVLDLADETAEDNLPESPELQWGQWANWASWTKIA
ncbi:hypothetical protein QA943_07075 [Streptomyces sp. B21-097]|uniref:hypothetical protein n=1 Tax=Streptomyces sp. B21-097 TaxID=3039414 RepID=UPI002FF33CE6